VAPAGKVGTGAVVETGDGRADVSGEVDGAGEGVEVEVDVGVDA
jgi:hypothetical protein